MSARDESYPGPGYELRVPAELWQQALDVLRHYGRLGSEGLVYLSGVTAAADVAVVTGLIVMGHSAQGGTVVVEPDEARWLLRTMRARDEKLLAQFHSHQGAAFHSHGDDARATSFHVGFMSLVAPRFGQGVTGIEDCAACEFDGRTFVELDPGATERRITVIPSRVERRGLPAAPQSRWWSRLWSG